jgi:autonomous glycyl radical cofactor GrcA
MNIRSNLIKVIYKEDMEILQQVKNEARNTLTSEADEFYKDFLNPINKMTKIEYTELEAKLKENPDMNLGRLFDMNKIPNKLLDETAHKITELNKILPKKGRIAYKLLPPDVKVKVDEIVEYIIENIPEFKKEFNTYKEMSRALTNFYTTNTKTLDNAEQKAHEELRKRLANKLLSNIKSINYNNYLEAKGMREKQMMRNMATKIIMDLFKFLTSTNEAKQKRYDNYKGELSKQAKKEMAIRMQNAGAIDWENER